MALTSEQAAAVLPWFEKKVRDIWWRADPFTAKLYMGTIGRKQVLQGGSPLKFELSYRHGANVEEYGDEPAKVFNIEFQDTLTEMETDWTSIQGNTAIPTLEVLKNRGPGMIVDRWKNRRTQLATAVKLDIAKKIHGRDANTDLPTLPQLIAPAGGFMGLAVADLVGFHPTDAALSLWAPQTDTAEHEVTYDAWSDMINNVAEGMDEYVPDMILTNPSCWNKARKLFQPQQRYVDEQMLKAGFKRQFSVDQVPVYPSLYVKGSGKGTADNHAYFLTTKNLGIHLLEGDDFKTENPVRPANQRIEVVQTFVSLAWSCVDRFHQGGFTTLDPGIAA